jgi:Holliday junction resolvase RusA-like endonuclease
MAITFSVSGNPVAQPRPRVVVRVGKPHGYVKKKHPIHAYRQAMQVAAIDAGLRKTADPVSVVIDAVFKRPKSHLNKNGVKTSAPAIPIPDVDNVAKAVLDAIGPILGNDRLVSRLVVEKSYGTQSRTTVRIT